MTNGMEIPVTKPRYVEVKEKFFDYKEKMQSYYGGREDYYQKKRMLHDYNNQVQCIRGLRLAKSKGITVSFQINDLSGAWMEEQDMVILQLLVKYCHLY